MSEPRTICAVTSSRADFGGLYWVLRRVAEEPSFRLQIIATGTHLSPEFGLTVQEIEDDGFVVTDRVEMLLSADTPTAVARSAGLGLMGIADAYSRLKPDLILLFGDRYEILAAAQAALFLKIPVAHLGGGDITRGAIDDCMRHAITKLSHLHFPANEEARERIIQMGESPDRVLNFGTPALDRIRQLDFVDRPALEQFLGFEFRKRNALITFHPVTLDDRGSAGQLEEPLAACASLGPDFGLIFTMPNADPEGRALMDNVKDFVGRAKNAVVVASLGSRRYLSCIRQVDVVIGNSSSGLYEVPSLRKPTVNIGSRQLGRLLASSVLTCEPEREAIRSAIDQALELDCSGVENPQGDGHASERILEHLRKIENFEPLLHKEFWHQVE